MRVTQRAIAEILGIDRTTVSKALAGAPSIPAGLRARVKALCDDLGYRPHLGAVSLSSFRTRTLSVVGGLKTVEGVQLVWVMYLHQAAQQRGYRCRFDSLGDVPAVVAEASADGFIVLGDPDIPCLGREDSPPVIYTDCGEVDNPVNSVTTGGADAAADAVAYLNGLGHERIAYFGIVPDHGVSADRCSGFRQEMARRGLELPQDFVIVQDDWPIEVEDSYAYRDRLLAAVRDGATAVITTKDVTAVAVVKMLAEAGLKVPDDVSVVAWDDTLLTRATTPQLTTVRQTLEKAAEVAVDMLISLVESGERFMPGTVVPSELVVRESTAPVPSRRP